MRHLFIILLIFISFHSLGQVSVSEMMNLYKMDASEFETYALKNKYLYNGIIDKNGKVKEIEYIVKGIEYRKDNNQEEYSDVFLSYLITFVNKGKAILYQTKKINDYINFKSQLKIYGLQIPIDPIARIEKGVKQAIIKLFFYIFEYSIKKCISCP